MYVSRNILAVAGGLVLLVVVLGLLIVELGQANAALQAARTDLNETSAALGTVRGHNANLLNVLEQANANIATMNVEVAEADAKVVAANAEIEKGNETIAELNDTVKLGEERLETANREWTAKHNAVTEENGQLRTERDALQNRYSALEAKNGTIEQLQSEESWLQAEISRLEEMRKPLILGHDTTGRSGFACTGSMEPKITCLDEATWLTDFEPEDIVVGTTISFNPDCEEDQPDDRGTAHRVMKIEVRDGVHYYWPKGDNNLEADGCWVPEQHVRGYIVEIHRDVRPANATLRTAVNLAKAERNRLLVLLDEAEERLDQADTAVENARSNYRAVIAQFCGANVEPQNCSLPDYQYNQAIASYNVYLQAHRVYDQAYNEYRRVLALYKPAYDHYYCWYQSAKKSEYPGHIPYSC